MGALWGRDDRGPGGDPSWLGEEREHFLGGNPVGDSDADRVADSDFASAAAGRPPEPAAPVAREDTAPEGRGRGRKERSKPMNAQVAGVIGSTVGVIVFAVIVLRSGMEFAWMIAIVALPMIFRALRLLWGRRRRG